MVDTDVDDYQTVFAKQPGAVAAPTAGLHFTKQLLQEIKQTGVETSTLTLHVGMGTFRPIAVENLEEHPMHTEWAELTQESAEKISACRASGGRIVAVGTTVTRVLETVAAQQKPAGSSDRLLHSWQGETNLFIRPPYEFRATDALLTNFHFPRTTLLLLVQALGGTELIRAAYEEAVAQEAPGGLETKKKRSTMELRERHGFFVVALFRCGSNFFLRADEDFAILLILNS